MLSQVDLNNVKKWYVQDIPFLDDYKKKKIQKQNDNSDEERYSDHAGLIMVLNMDIKMKVKPNRITWNLDKNIFQNFYHY